MYSKLKFLILIAAAVLLAGCSSRPPATPSVADQVCENDTTLYTYLYQLEGKLSGDFLTLDEHDKPVDPAFFWKQLATGAYLPVQVSEDGKKLKCRLEPLAFNLNAALRGITIEWGQRHAYFHEMQGKPLPGFKFRDMNGRLYDPLTTRGKIVVLKCWFIACPNCIEEMPRLNQLRAFYKHRKDIVFLSLALDKEADLRTFLAKVPFSYAVVPDERDYLLNTLKISLYPTHVILGRDGKIFRFLDSGDELSDALHQLAGSGS